MMIVYAFAQYFPSLLGFLEYFVLQILVQASFAWVKSLQVAELKRKVHKYIVIKNINEYKINLWSNYKNA